MQVAVGKWKDLPKAWEGVNGLYTHSATRVKALARRKDDGVDPWLGVYDVSVFEDMCNQYIDDGSPMFDPITYWIKFITEEGEKVI